MRRPSSRWLYSHQKMPLNSASDMRWFTCLNSGVAWYLAKVSLHCASESGGKAPTMGCHSTMDRPECVRRVAPPTTVMAKSRAQEARSHAAVARRGEGAGGRACRGGREGGGGGGPFSGGRGGGGWGGRVCMRRNGERRYCNVAHGASDCNVALAAPDARAMERRPVRPGGGGAIATCASTR